jgi:hypothetical protein
LEEIVYEYLTADATFSARFDSIYWMEAPDTAAYPFLVLWQVDDAGVKTHLHTGGQGEARIQLDVWDSDKARGVRNRTKTREKIEALNETRDGYTVWTVGYSEQTVPRDSAAAPHHYVVDAVIHWRS